MTGREPTIRVEGVGKRYRLGSGHEMGGKLSQRLEAGLRAPGRRLRGRAPQAEKRSEFWALRDVSFEVARGEIFGLLGANGAGKSTMLKLLGRITPPTEGRITLAGRVGCLLEVGTGFNQELTGRENVFLNGAILGLKRREILDRFDAIVEFSGIGDFLDTPVKRYSSGMVVRLGFAVAAHLEPEILLVDEVLAVGDADYQRKCMRKIREIATVDGRTILFVSHNMESIRRLCGRAIWLDHGDVRLEGPAEHVLTKYLEHAQPVQHGGVSEIDDKAHRVGTGEARLRRVALLDASGNPVERIRFGEPITLALTFEASSTAPPVAVLVGISTQDGVRALTSASTDGGAPLLSLEPGGNQIQAELRTTLLPGEFVIDVGLIDEAGATVDYIDRVLSFAALNVPFEGDDHYPWATVRGFVRPDSEWTVGEHGQAMAGELRAVR